LTHHISVRALDDGKFMGEIYDEEDRRVGFTHVYASKAPARLFAGKVKWRIENRPGEPIPFWLGCSEVVPPEPRQFDGTKVMEAIAAIGAVLATTPGTKKHRRARHRLADLIEALEPETVN